MGLDDVAKLAAADLDDILEQGAQLTGSTCWKNSPQAKAAIASLATSSNPICRKRCNMVLPMPLTASRDWISSSVKGISSSLILQV